MIRPFLNARHGWNPAQIIHPDLLPILSETEGVVVFHEQVISIISVMTGISLAAADEKPDRPGDRGGDVGGIGARLLGDRDGDGRVHRRELALLGLGVPYAVALGLIVALLDLIPLAGATLAAVQGAAAAAGQPALPAMPASLA